MNILFLSIEPWETFPESGMYTDLLSEFSQRGHHVYIASAREKRLNLPTVKEVIDGVTLLKIKISNITGVGRLQKGLATLLVENQYLKAIKQHYADVTFDLVMYATPPITFYNVVKFIKQRDNAKAYLQLKDIFPQNAVDLNMMRENSFIHKYFRRKEKELYALSDYIGTMSEANTRYLLQHNPEIDPAFVEVSPNIIKPRHINISAQDKAQIHQKYQIPQDKVIFLYGGNLGKPQGIDFLIAVIKGNEHNQHSHLLIVGSGTEYRRLEKFFQAEKIQNATLLKFLPKDEYDILANTCDVGLVLLDYRFTIPNFPSRILSYMQASMPVITATDEASDVGDVVEAGQFGFKRNSQDVAAFVSLLDEVAQRDDLTELGRNGRHYLETHYTAAHAYDIIMRHFEAERKEG